jgi:hypothetical protein
MIRVIYKIFSQADFPLKRNNARHPHPSHPFSIIATPSGWLIV